MITFWSFGALINFITSSVLGALVLLKNWRRPLNITYGLFCFCCAIWSFSYFMWQSSDNEFDALFWSRLLMAGAIFIPIFFLHHLSILLSLTRKKLYLIGFTYCFGLFFLSISFTSSFISGVSPNLWFKYWPEPGIAFPWFCAIWFWVSIYGVWIVARGLVTAEGNFKAQLRYVLIATILGWGGAFTNFPLWFDIKIPPVGNIFVSFYLLLTAYAIIKYRLMDIKVAITRAGIFLFVYTLVLGVPFGLGFKFLGVGGWLIPCILMSILATVGPFVYLFMQKKAEGQLLAEQHRYQATLRRASLGMGRVKDLKHLLNLVVHIITRTVRIEHASVYLLHKDSGQYTLKAAKGFKTEPEDASVFGVDAPLIKYLNKVKTPILYEEIQQQAEDYEDRSLREVGEVLKTLNAELAVPCIIDERMLAVVILGKKRSGKMYTTDDLVVFSILASQSALAIENAMFYEQTKKTTEQLFKAEKMATIGTMADGLSHQINNRFHAMGFVAGDALDTVRILQKKKNLDENTMELLGDMEYALGRIQDNVKRGGEIVGGLLSYTRKGSEGIEPVDLSELLDASLEMAQFKIKIDQFEFVRNFNGSISKIEGNFTQLQEVFFNIIDNAYDAMMQRKTDLKEEGYKAKLEVSVNPSRKKMDIIIQDNGMGVKDEDKHKIFTPFFTTKATAKKGTGLGMYVIRQIIEENHGGKVDFTSKYKQGSQTIITLPIVSDKNKQEE